MSKMKKKRESKIGAVLGNKKIGVLLSLFHLLITILFSILVINLNVLPNRFLFPVLGLLFGLWLLVFLTQIGRKGRKGGKFIALLLSIILIIGSGYIIRGTMALSTITEVKKVIDDVSVLVLKEDPAQNITDAKDYTFGILEDIDRENTDKTVESINKELDKDITTKSFDDLESLVEALYNQDVGAIVFNEVFRGSIAEIYEDFSDRTRIISDYEHESIVIVKKEDKDKKPKNVGKEAFNVYISGIDTYGSIGTKSRSDVNIIATINPKTKKILLTNTPRDYYVPFPNTDGVRDKLTHSGVYGIDMSVGALEELYDTDISYYVRVNFSSLIKMVDSLGGIKVNSDYGFSAGGYSFSKGENHLNGDQALAFSRERKKFSDGDNQRGKNQMAVIKGMIDKAMSPAILTNYNDILKSVEGSFETNMSSREITDLVKSQVDDMSPWDIESNAVTGQGAMKTTYTYRKQSLFVYIPDESSVEDAKNKINAVLEGR